MKKILYACLSAMLILCNSCKDRQEINQIQKWKDEIADTEKMFAEMTAEKGITEAFTYYSADDVVILRRDSLIIGKTALNKFYKSSESDSQKVMVTWKPDFIDVSKSGDLGYTYGRYQYLITDLTGKKDSASGYFHTVWKRQSDGNWRFVWD